MADTRQDQATRGGSDEAGRQFGTVFYVSVGISVAFVVGGVLFTEPFSMALSSVVDRIVAGLGWLYLLLTTLFLAFVLVLAFSRYGKIRLGGPDATTSSGLNASTAVRIWSPSTTTLQPTSWPRSSSSTKMRWVRLLKAVARSRMRTERLLRGPSRCHWCRRRRLTCVLGLHTEGDQPGPGFGCGVQLERGEAEPQRDLWLVLPQVLGAGLEHPARSYGPLLVGGLTLLIEETTGRGAPYASHSRW